MTAVAIAFFLAYVLPLAIFAFVLAGLWGVDPDQD